MLENLATSTRVEADQKPHSGPQWPIVVALALLGALWFILIQNLRVEWSVNAQYAYGWSVPFLCAYLLSRYQFKLPEPESFQLLGPVKVMILLLALIFLPTRLVLEANPDWRLASWVLAFEVCGITLGLAYWIGGWNLLWQCSFPVCFFLVAVPWPSPLEKALIERFTAWNTAATMELLRFWGIPAIQAGNVIQIGKGAVGIDDACSGVRSFQAAIMLSLFFGEFYRLNLRRRGVLLMAGIALAVLCNLIRTFILVWVSDRDGISAINRWHDPTGVTILLICFLGLWGMSYLFRPLASDAKTETTGFSFPKFTLPKSATLPVVALAFWVALVEVTTEGWYRAHETQMASAPRWSVQWPSGNRFRDVAIPEAARAMLRYNEGRSGAWSEPDGKRWQVFYFKWLPTRAAAQLAKGHSPDVCLPASGRRLVTPPFLKQFQVKGIVFPFRIYTFEENGRPLHMFFCLWEERKHALEDSRLLEDGSRQSRTAAVLAGRRNQGQRVLEIAAWGFPNLDEAVTAFEKQLQEMVQPL